MASTAPKFRIAVCGGGVGGVVAAYALGQNAEIEVDLYEAASQFGEIGAGIAAIWRSWAILKMLGLEQDLLPLTDRPPSDDIVTFLHGSKSDQPEPGVHFANIVSRGAYATFLRSEFHNAIMSRFSPRVRTHTSKRLVSYEEPEFVSGDSYQPITLTFKDGSTATCDILVGADGIKSAVRVAMYEKLAQEAVQQGDLPKADELLGLLHAKYSGATVYRTLIPVEKLRAVSPTHPAPNGPIHYMGRNRHIVSYPVKGGNLINVANYEVEYSKEGTLYTDPWVVAGVDTKLLIDAFKDWEPEARELVGCMDGLTVNKWAVNVVAGLPTFVTSRVALLGDAAHAMTPFQGAGAGQAIEDAYILSALLSNPLVTRATIPTALEVYSKIRLPFAAMVFERSRQAGKYLAFYDSANPTLESSEWDLKKLQDDMQRNTNWQIEAPHPKDEMEKAVRLLKQKLSASTAGPAKE